MVQDVKRLALAGYLADMLIEARPVELDAVEQEELRGNPGDRAPVAVVDPVLVIGDGEEIVAECFVCRDELSRFLDAVRESREREGCPVARALAALFWGNVRTDHRIRAQEPDVEWAAGRPR